ncbi:hypothetical protein FQA39_LY00480 [Lamprigera yunnana]|nr:hypothetical protein FQA39_LY00480 [Lamprigera yunnana]
MKFSTICKKRYLRQYLIALSGCIFVLTSGINLGWTSPYLPEILNGNYDISITSNEGSWIAVMPLAGSIPGALIMMLVVDKIGRKLSILLMAPIACISFITLAYAYNGILIALIRFIIGAVEGGLYTVLPMYLGEISDPEIRGILTGLMAVFTILGTLLINALGFHYSIFISSIICSIIPVIHFVTFVWVPESPYYLIKRNRHKEAEESLNVLRGTIDVQEELQSLQVAVAQQECDKKSKFKDLFCVKSNRKAFMIYLIVCFARKFSGKNPLLFYTTAIFESAGGGMDSQLSVIIFICVEALSAMLGVLLIDKIGRRPLLIASTSICATALCLTGLHFIFKDDAPYLSMFNWLPLTSLTIYNVFYTVGLELAQTVYVGELFPISIKAIALGFADMLSVTNGIIVSKIFQIINDHLGIEYAFFFFSACCASGFLLIIKYVRETKNKTLEEIQSELKKKTSS